MDPIAVDVPARVPPAPAATTVAPAAKPPALPSKPEPAKPDAPKADPAKPPFPTPAPAAESKSVLGKVANALGLQPTRRQTMIVGAAAVSLVAGIAAVRLVTPDKKPDAAGQPLVAEAAKGGKESTPPAAEHSKPRTEAEPPAPVVEPPAPRAPSTRPEPVVKLPDVPLGPAVSVQNDVPPAPAVPPIAPPAMPVELPGLPSAKPAPPAVTVLPPADPGAFGPPKKKADTSAAVAPEVVPPVSAVPPPGDLVPIGPPSVVPAGGIEPAKPAAPVAPPVTPPMTPAGSGGPMVPALPAFPGDKPVSPPAKPAELPTAPPAVKPVEPAPSPPVATGGLPVTLPALPPSTAGTKPPTNKPADEKKPVVSPSGISLPTPPPSPPAATGGLPETPSKPMTLGFTKTAGSTDPKPAAAPERAATTSYDVDLHEPKSGDTYESISREFYNDPKYAPALREYNGRRPLTNVRVEVPPIHVLKTRYPQLVGPVVPAGRSADGWGPAGGGGGVAPAFQPTGARTYTVPTGGMRMPDIAKAALGNPSRWKDIYDLNPQLSTNEVLPAGTLVKLPAN